MDEQQFERDMDSMLRKVSTKEEGMELMADLLSVAHPNSVYGEPITSGEYTLITASEVFSSLGFGFGAGGGSGPHEMEGEEPHEMPPTPEGLTGEAEEKPNAMGMGAGGGGGGASMARPVAVISVGPNGVRVEPILDMNKIGIAALAALGGMVLALGRMMRASHR